MPMTPHTMKGMTMERTILVHQHQVAVIIAHSPTAYTVECFVDDISTVAYETHCPQAAERWAKAVITYPY
jgi:hypothetical protein